MIFDVSGAESHIGYVFKNKELLRQAFTHSSYASEKNVESNQRMEYLGDSVLSFVVADSLYRKFKDADEKSLTNMRSGIVRKETLYSAALNLNLEELLLFGEGERKSVKREKILEDLFEAVTGAVYLDGGILAAAKFIKFALKMQLNQSQKYEKADSKSILSELSQKKFGKRVNYVTIKQEGSAHSPIFTLAAVVNGVTYKEATASNKKQAQQLAAKNALESLNGVKKHKKHNNNKNKTQQNNKADKITIADKKV